MEAQVEDPTEEIGRLRRCVSDLVSVLALPAIWTGGEPSEVVSTLLNALLEMLRLDFVCVRLSSRSGEMPFEMMRIAPSLALTALPNEISDLLNHISEFDAKNWPHLLRGPVGDADISIVPLQIGFQGEIGVIVAGSRRVDFPGQTERLVLSVAANQAAIGLQEARLLDDQRRLAKELDRRVAERTRELAATNEELRLQVGLLQHLPVSAWTLQPDGTPDFVNQVWLEFSGQTLDFIRSHPEAWMTAIHPEDREAALRSFWEGVRSGQDFAIETRSLRAQDGTYRWHLQQAVVLRDAEGKVLKFVGTTTDIDDQKRAEGEVRASEGKLRQIVDSIPGLVCTMDATGEIQQLNRPLLKYFGKTSEELKGWKMTDAVHPDDVPEVVKAYTYSVRTGTPYDIEHRCRRADGVYRWFQVRALAVRDTDNNICGWYVLLTDIEDLKLAEEALKASESNLRDVLDNIPGMVSTLSPTGDLELGNEPFIAYFGKTLEEIKDWSSNNIVYPDDLPNVIASFTRSIETGEPINLEHRLRRADGAYRWLLSNGRPVRDTEGRIERWYVLTTEIDDRKRAEDELRRTEARYRVVVETASDAVVSIDESGVIILANPATNRVFGYTPEELIGKPLTVLMPGAMRSLHEGGFKRYLETGTRHLNWRGTVMTAQRANGEEFPAEVSFGETTSNHQKVFTGFIRDITDKKRAEEAILANERKLSLIINTMPVLAWSALPDGTVEFFNQRWLDYTGLSPEQAQGSGWTEAVHYDDLGRMTNHWQSIMATGASGEVEARFRRFDGNYRWFLFRADPMRDDSGAIIKWYGTNTDIDDWKQAQEELRNTQAELSHLTRVMTMGQLTASIAHEINQPLAGIMMNAATCLRMLDSDPPNIDGARETARRTIRDGNRASDVITRLRDLFRKKDAAAESVDLNDATREVIALSLSELQGNSVVVQLEFAENLPPVKGDRIQIQQVILNLLRNASDAMRDVGDRSRQLLIKTERDDGRNVQLTVRDTGIGFAPNAADRLFESFYTTKDDGMGIGLSISRSIIEAHGGRLWASANDGPGTSFAFSIPYNDNTQLTLNKTV